MANILENQDWVIFLFMVPLCIDKGGCKLVKASVVNISSNYVIYKCVYLPEIYFCGLLLFLLLLIRTKMTEKCNVKTKSFLSTDSLDMDKCHILFFYFAFCI